MGVAERRNKRQNKDSVTRLGVAERRELKSLENELNSFLTTNNNLFTTAEEDSKYTGYRANSQDWYSNYKSQVEKQRQIAEGLKSKLNKYSSYLDKDFLTKTSDYISSLDDPYSKITDYAKGQYDYFSKFEDEDAYKEAVKAQKVREDQIALDVDKYQKETDEKQKLYDTAAALKHQIDLGLKWGDPEGNVTKAKQKLKKLGLTYDGVDDLHSEILERQTYLTQAKYQQKKAALEGVGNSESDVYDPNFDSYVEKGYELAMDEGDHPALIAHQGGDPLKDKKGLEKFIASYGVDYEIMGLSRMKDEEYDTYAYWVGYDKENGTNRAQEYLDVMELVLADRESDEMAEYMEDKVALELAFGAVVGLDQFASGLANVFNTEDDYITPSAIQLASGKVREDLADDGFELFGSSIGQIGYDFITTTANMAPSILASAAVGTVSKTAGAALGASLMGASSAGNAYADMVNAGYTKDQARTYSTLVGVSEAGLQYALGGISKLGSNTIGKFTSKALGGIAKGINSGAIQFALKYGGKFVGNVIGEGFEEGLQEILDPFFKSIATGEKPQGVDWEQAAYSGFLGALSAGFLEGGGYVASRGVDIAKAESIKNEGNWETLKDVGTTFSADSVAYKLADKVTEKTGAYKLSMLLHDVNASLSEQNIQDIETALVEKGIASENAKSIAKWLGRAVDGGKLTKTQQMALEDNPIISQVFREIIVDSNSNLNQRRQGLMDLYGKEGTAGIDLTALQESTTKETLSEKINARNTIEDHIKRMAEDTVRQQYGLGPAVINRGRDTMIDSMVSDATKIATDSKKTVEDVINEGNKVSEENGVSVKKFTSIGEDGTAMVETGDGIVEDSDDIQFKSRDDAYIVLSTANMAKEYSDLGIDFDANSANAVVNGYTSNSGVSALVYMEGAKDTVRYGVIGQNRDKIPAESPYHKLTKSQQDYLYKIGRDIAENTTNKEESASTSTTSTLKKSKNGKVTKVIKSKLKPSQSTAISTVEKLSDIGILKNNFYFFESKRATAVINGKRINALVFTEDVGGYKKGELAPNGVYQTANGDIYIDINSGVNGEGLTLYTLAHELGHFVRHQNPAGFKVLADFVANERDIDLEELINKKLELWKRLGRKGRTYMDAYEDVICDALEPMFTEGNLGERLVEYSKPTTEGMGLIKTLKEFFSNLYERIQKAYAKLDYDDPAAKIIAKNKKAVGELADLLAKAIVGATENFANADIQAQKNTTSEGDVKTSLRGFTKDGRRVYETDFTDDVSMDERIKLFKKRIATIFNLGAVELKTDVKKIKVEGDKFTAQKNLYGDILPTEQERNAKINALYDMADILSTSKYIPTKTTIEPSHSNPNLTPKNAAHKGVKYWYKFQNEIVFDGVPFTVTFNIRDKGKNQYEYLIEFKENKTPGLSNTVYKDLLRTDQVSNNRLAQNKPIVNTYSMQESENNSANTAQKNTTSEGDVKYSIRPDFAAKFDAWDKKTVGSQFRIGTTSKVLQSLGVDQKKIYWDTSKIKKIQATHPEMTDEVIKQVPNILEEPILVMESATVTGRLTLFGEVYDSAGAPVLAVLELNPTDKNGHSLNVIKIASAYGKSSNPQGLINKSKILYVDPNKNRTNSWLSANGLQLPKPSSSIGSTNSINQNDSSVNTYSMQESKNNSEKFSDRDVARYTEKQYNDFGWASYNDVITTKEREILLSRYADFKHNKNKYPVTRFGETVVHSDDCSDVIMYVKGSIASPKITKVVRIDYFYTAEIKEEILNNERRHLSEPYAAIEYFYGEEILSISKARDYASFQEYKSEQKRSNSGKSDTNSKKQRDGSGSIGENQDSNEKSDQIKRSDRDYSYNALVSKPDMKVAVLDGNVPNNRADVVAEAKKNAVKVGKFNTKDGSVSVRVDDIDSDVIMSTAGLRHSLDRRLEVNAPVVLKAGEILQNSIRINELTPQKSEASESYVLIGAAKSSDGQLYIVRSVVNRFKNELVSMDVLYAINAKTEPIADNKKRNQPGDNPQDSRLKNHYLSDSTISISNLLDYVNQYFPDILPEDVLKHYGHDSRPEGKIGKDALFSDRNFYLSSRNLLANALESTAKNNVEREWLGRYKEQIQSLNEDQKRLDEINAEIREISFNKGTDRSRLTSLNNNKKTLAARITRADKKLLEFEASKPLKNVLEAERKRAAQKANEKAKEMLKAEREKSSQREQELMENARERIRAQREKSLAKIEETKKHYQESRKKNVEGRQKTELRNKIKRTVKKLNHLLVHGSKEHNVKIELQDTARKAILAADQLFDKDGGEGVGECLSKLRFAYDSLARSESKLAKDAYNIETSQKIHELQSEIGDTPLSELSKATLEKTYDCFKLIYTTITNVNKLFKDGKAIEVSSMSWSTINEMEETGLEIKHNHSKKVGEAIDKIDSFSWAELKPVYAFERLGSKTMMELYWDAVRADGICARNVDDAAAFMNEQKSKFGYANWDLDKTKSFILEDGKEFKLTISDIMSIYAYSKREQAHDHILKGGFMFSKGKTFTEGTGDKKKVVSFEKLQNTSETYRLNADILAKIIATLEQEFPGAKEYVDVMQRYLSDVMGEKGNEVSRVLYGIDLFKEKHYFPLKSSTDFLNSVQEALQKTPTQTSLKNIGMAKETVPHASNPIMLESFEDVWKSHVIKMSQYNAYVIPIENLQKVFNFERNTEKGGVSVKNTINRVFGENASQYVDNWIIDLNGGMNIPGYKSPLMKRFATFKKVKTAASLSTTIQQYSAVVRATALVDSKYFISPKRLGKTVKLGELYGEMRKYAPVTIVKEIGGFDVGSSGSAMDYMSFGEYDTFGNKFKGFFTDKDYAKKAANDAFMAGAAAMDKLGWMTIWSAVKNEVASETSITVGSKEFFDACSKRFTEVIAYTQVYDSIVSRSGIMRSKSELNKFATAFMGEPTTSINMLFNAALQIKRAKKGSKFKAVKNFARVSGAVYGSTALAALSASLIYALWDDEDEDESLLEKWAWEFGGKLSDEVNPLNMLPYARDIISITQGYTIERPDMSVIADLIGATKDTYKAITSEQQEIPEAVMDLTQQIAAFYGVPLGNIVRDVKGIVHLFNDITDDIQPTDIGEAFVKGFAGKSDKDFLWEALINNDTEKLDEVKKRYKTEGDYKAAVRKVLKENDSRIKKAAEAKYNGDFDTFKQIVNEMKAEGHFSQNDIVSAINSMLSAVKKENEEETITEWYNEESAETEAEASVIYVNSDINDALEWGDTAKAKEIVNDIVAAKVKNGKTEAEAKSAIKSSLALHWKEIYLSSSDSEKVDIRKMLKATGVYSGASEIVKLTRKWEKDSK